MAGTSIYLILDMINDVIHADGPNGKTGFGPQVRARQLIANTNVALAKARAAGVPVGFVRVGFSPDYRECPTEHSAFARAREAGLFKLGSWGTKVHPEIPVEPSDFDIVKHRVSPFYGTTLELILRRLGMQHIYLSGVSSIAVVQAGVREGHDRDFRMTVIEDGCCGTNAAEHEASMAMLGRYAAITTAAAVNFSAS